MHVDLDLSVEKCPSSNITFHCSAVVQLLHQECQNTLPISFLFQIQFVRVHVTQQYIISSAKVL